MLAGLRAARAVLRSAGAPALVAGAIAVLVASAVLPVEPVRVPGRPDVRSVVWPLAPVLAALAVPVGAMVRYRSWEWVAARPPWHSRALFAGLLALRGVALAVTVPYEPIVVARNLALFDALALLGVLVARRPTWWVLVAVPVVSWMAGTDPSGAVRWWAIPLRPPSHGASSRWTAGLVALAVVAYVAVPPREA